MCIYCLKAILKFEKQGHTLLAAPFYLCFFISYYDVANPKKKKHNVYLRWIQKVFIPFLFLQTLS